MDNDTKQNWGQGLDYLFSDYHDGIDRLVANHLKQKYDRYLIKGVALGMSQALEKAENIFKEKWPEEKSLFDKIHSLQLLYWHSFSWEELVVFITLTEQFLRSIY